MKFQKVFIQFTTLLLLASCGNINKDTSKFKFEPREVTQEETREPEGSHGEVLKKVAFKELKSQLLEPYRCTNCHGWASKEVEVIKRIVPGNAEDSRIYILVKDGRMPIGSSAVPTKELEILEIYIKNFRK